MDYLHAYIIEIEHFQLGYMMQNVITCDSESKQVSMTGDILYSLYIRGAYASDEMYHMNQTQKWFMFL